MASWPHSIDQSPTAVEVLLLRWRSVIIRELMLFSGDDMDCSAGFGAEVPIIPLGKIARLLMMMMPRKPSMISEDSVRLSSATIRRPGQRIEKEKSLLSLGKWLGNEPICSTHVQQLPGRVYETKTKENELCGMCHLNTRAIQRKSQRCMSNTRIAASLD